MYKKKVIFVEHRRNHTKFAVKTSNKKTYLCAMPNSMLFANLHLNAAICSKEMQAAQFRKKKYKKILNILLFNLFSVRKKCYFSVQKRQSEM